MRNLLIFAAATDLQRSMSCHVNVSFCDENEMASNSQTQIVSPTTSTGPSVQIVLPEKVRLVFVVES